MKLDGCHVRSLIDHNAFKEGIPLLDTQESVLSLWRVMIYSNQMQLMVTLKRFKDLTDPIEFTPSEMNWYEGKLKAAQKLFYLIYPDDSISYYLHVMFHPALLRMPKA